MTRHPTRAPIPGALLLATLGGCTTLLGVDGEYETRPEGTTTAASSSAATTTSGSSSSTTTTSSVGSASASNGSGGDGGVGGGGAGGNDGGADPGTGGGGEGGFGGRSPLEPAICDWCGIDYVEELEDATRPWMTHLESQVSFAHLTGDGVYAIDRGGVDTYLDVNAKQAVAVSAPQLGDAVPELYWSSYDGVDGQIRRDGVPIYPALVGPYIAAIRDDDTSWVAGTVLDGRPELLDCTGATETTECEEVSRACNTTASTGTMRDVALDRHGNAVQFGRICGDDIEVFDTTDLETTVFEDDNVDGVDEIAVTLANGALYVLAILDAGEAAARVRIYPPTPQEPVTVAVPGARSPAMVHIYNTPLGTFSTPWGLAMVWCNSADDCRFGMLQSNFMDGAEHPSLAVYLVGGPDDPSAEQHAYLAWEGFGNMRWGRLIPTLPR